LYCAISLPSQTSVTHFLFPCQVCISTGHFVL
jgi:hypothetical protein